MLVGWTSPPLIRCRTQQLPFAFQWEVSWTHGEIQTKSKTAKVHNVTWRNRPVRKSFSASDWAQRWSVDTLTGMFFFFLFSQTIERAPGPERYFHAIPDKYYIVALAIQLIGGHRARSGTWRGCWTPGLAAFQRVQRPTTSGLQGWALVDATLRCLRKKIYRIKPRKKITWASFPSVLPVPTYSFYDV